MKKLFTCVQAAIVMTSVVVPLAAQQNQPRLVEAIAPVYPTLALYSSTAGEVKVRLTLDDTGTVTATKVIQGHKLLAAPTEEAAKKWRFAAARTVAEVDITFVFRILPRGTADSELTTRFRSPFQIEVRGVIPQAMKNSDPVTDPVKRRPK